MKIKQAVSACCFYVSAQQSQGLESDSALNITLDVQK